MSISPWIVILAVLIANCGFWLFCFNQINATGLPRPLTKRLEKLLIVLCFLIPLSCFVADRDALLPWLFEAGGWWPVQAVWFDILGVACLVSSLVLGGLWLESRLWMIPPRQLLKTQTEDFDVHRSIVGGTPADSWTKFLHGCPANEIGLLQVTQKELVLPRAIAGLDGLKIGHLSDVHLTGQYRQAHYEFVFDRLMDHEPDLIVISGDLIDYDHCLTWVEPLFRRLKAPLGCSFVLGNHDCRLSDISQLLDILHRLGFHDLGARQQQLRLDNGSHIQLLGNEGPWLERRLKGNQQGDREFEIQSRGDEHTLRIAVSHSPDQIPWARNTFSDLMLAGHTHGGQVRFPCLGPIVAPSHFGSRFASGVFYLPPTLVHVSRGIAGTHPIRFRCKPEVSILMLTNDG